MKRLRRSIAPLVIFMIAIDITLYLFHLTGG
jgi:hypothetical protein